MLTTQQIATLRDAAYQIADPINAYLLQDIARRISEAGQLTSTAQYQIWRTQQLGFSQKEIEKKLQQLLRVSQEEIRRILHQSAQSGYSLDVRRFPTVEAVPFGENEPLQQIVSAAVKLAQEDFSNLAQTMGMVDPFGNALPLQKAYRACTDFAFKQGDHRRGQLHRGRPAGHQEPGGQGRANYRLPKRDPYLPGGRRAAEHPGRPGAVAGTGQPDGP